MLDDRRDIRKIFGGRALSSAPSVSRDDTQTGMSALRVYSPSRLRRVGNRIVRRGERRTR